MQDGGLDKNLSLKTAFENNINLLLSLILNILATVAIAYKAWVVGTQVQKMLWLMVDSGAVFCVLQGVYFGMLISGSQSKEASDNSTHFEKYAMIISPLSAMVIVA
ncbi:hypothetical protein D9757_004459 [Collybiopsis confluens]|uniref:Uncharacterized protein n=1 Tax=Collybiopsis confluens TaxID=2823264 RepID=A0A8H5MDW3_9AGAR|nr:hypothetical protein D9757_004459 [Collybiopsis confluens]